MNLPSLDEGEFGYSTDTQELFIGSSNGNISLAKKSDIPNETGSNISVSEDNGFIIVDGEELQVYNDQAILEALDLKANIEDLPATFVTINDDSISDNEAWSASKLTTEFDSKATTSHTHSLSNLTDVDATDRTNGNALQYDSEQQMFVSKSLPQGNGNGATSLNGLTDVDVSTIPPSQGHVLSYEDGIWKPIKSEGIPTDGVTSDDILLSIQGEWKVSPSRGTFAIELSRWGIETGFPEKPYVEEDYYKAKGNVDGINDALMHAFEAGYSEVILPKGDYSICYPYEILPQDYQTLNLGGSTLKVMYDSDSRSPFDTSSNGTHRFGGNTISFRNVRNAHLKNGRIIGCKYERSFIHSEERWVEWTYGVLLTGGSSYCSVSNCYVAGYMGDCVSFSSTGSVRTGTSGQGNHQVVGYVDNSEGNVIEDEEANSVVSALITIPRENGENISPILSLSGQGYSRTTNILSKRFDVYYYSNGDYLGRLTNNKVHAPVTVPPLATHFRMVYIGETNASKNMQIFINYGGVHHNLVEYNEIVDGHRGGITPGGSYNVIQYNELRDNGSSNGWMHGGVPTFPDSTRYGINQEDSYGDNTIIRGNHIYGSFHGMLIGVYSAFIENNVINNCGWGIRVYGMEYGHISGNYIQTGNPITSSGTSLLGAIQVIGNYCNGNIVLGNASYECIVQGNHVIGGGLQVANGMCEGNYVILKNGQSGTLEGDNIKRNKFIGMGEEHSSLMIYGAGPEVLEGNEFHNVKIDIFKYSGHLTVKNCTLNRCIVTTSSRSDMEVFTLNIKGCDIFDTQLIARGGVNSDAGLRTRMNISNSTLSISDGYENSYFVMAGTNIAQAVEINIENCVLQTDKHDLETISYSSNLNINSLSLSIKDTTIEYTGEGMLETQFNSREGTIHTGILADVIYKNVIIGGLVGDKYSFHNPDNSVSKNVSLELVDTIYKATVIHDLQTLNPFISIKKDTGELVTPSIFILDNKTVEIISNDDMEINVFIKRV
ncbi:right-handed parallel beta-helix repeat-containing protein [Salipaludibacillus neizhouensis]|uniref:right-handed parallel beta-helix repeat-containing protein n=1 Tax=Salipaludibacillus neizhouensis TaxID=885475 RepID=UPI0011C48E1B|nr:right-handed parallel beta-helix repeat-containing protein [Salipaludibacillus neizhouensis]